MITVYAIIATFFLGGFVRHNYRELADRYKSHRAHRKFVRQIEAATKKREEAEAKILANQPA